MSIGTTIAHKAEAARGRARRLLGRVLGNDRMQASGRAGQAKGNLKQASANIKKAFKN